MARVGDALQQALGRARARWPAVKFDGAAFGPKAAALQAAGEHLDELLLAAACLAQDAGALAELEQLLGRIRPSIVAVDNSPSFADEVMQALRVKLLVGRSQPGLASYQGRGPLVAWLRTAAVRLASTAKAQLRAGPPDSLIDELAAPDPELAYLKQTLGPVVQVAVQQAMKRLDPRPRALLNLVARGLTQEQLSVMYGCDRSTISRRLADARDALFQATTAELKRSCPREAPDSLMALAFSWLFLEVSG